MRRSPSLIILIVAIIILAILSVLPWNSMTRGHLKDFNLLSDLMPSSSIENLPANTNIDPELAALSVSQNDSSSQVVETDTVIEKPMPERVLPENFVVPRIDGAVAIEDYSSDGSGLSTLARKFSEASSRNVRIAMVGDSYIEGDILAQDIRAGLQEKYGGRGVGYVAAFSSFPGFRQSVSQAASGWEEHEIRKMKNDPLRTILGTYYSSTGSADSRFRKSVKPSRLDFWDRTTVLFTTQTGGTISFSEPESEAKTFEVQASDKIQKLSLEGRSEDIRFKSSIPDLKVLGFWLEGKNGIVLDDISLRGNSGISHRTLNANATQEMREYIDYDLIILEFGMNALSAQQTNYSAYGDAMVEVVKNLKNLYPRAQILIMGVGDRGQKNGSDVISMPTTRALIDAQRKVALKTGSLFWDTREAMGGEGAANEWHQRKLVNSDYVHLNHRGGKELAEIFLNSLEVSLK